MIYLLSQILQPAVERLPHKDAFRCRGEGISYAELDRCSSKLARTLVAAGVKPGDRVAIFMTKSLHVPVAVFAVLKAGAVYVPVDPAIPSERLIFVLDDAEVAAVLTSERQQSILRTVVPDLRSAPKLIVGAYIPADRGCQSKSWEQAADDDGALPTTTTDRDTDLASDCLPSRTEDDPAYIIYTSGSTGEPKGILHTHRSGLAYARLAVETYHVCDSDRLGNFAPLHFDQSTFDYFSGPLAGATTVLIPEEYTRFPASLAKLIDDECLTIWYSVPYALVQLLTRGALETRDLSTLRWVLYGGEPFPLGHLRDLMLRLPFARFSNVYGPAEVNQCTFYHLPEPPGDDGTIPIGEVWQNTEALIVGDDNESVGADSPGELLIRSPTMMAGYWNRPDLNDQVFFDVTRDGVKCRFYRTGDIVQRAPDGNLLFLGRRDRQVKIRGNRVELDEVESVLLSLPEVAEAAVFASLDSQTESLGIVGAVILQTGSEIRPEQLRSAVAKRLPAYAVPERIVQSDRFPRTTTGKTDYRMLNRETKMSGGDVS